ncbi:unnamed protein product [Blepharisma stoltei]|uniref:Uncharacterized protein n=1 Tax=Blepharisma stoltei TaxID=1481888 RepID=A0AAU9JJQ7_9CILI|nr:unnamed protein product [Blepharisma stoltei]
MFYQNTQFKEPYTFRRLKSLPNLKKLAVSGSMYTPRTGIKGNLTNQNIRKRIERCIAYSIDFDRHLPSLNWMTNSIEQLNTWRPSHEEHKETVPYAHPLEKLAITWRGEHLDKANIIIKLNEYERSYKKPRISITSIPEELVEELAKTNYGRKILKDASVNMPPRKLYSLDNYQKIKQGLSDRDLLIKRSARINSVYKSQ